ncbi:unnamed protein product, partial [Cuscuta epithymum]
MVRPQRVLPLHAIFDLPYGARWACAHNWADSSRFTLRIYRDQFDLTRCGGFTDEYRGWFRYMGKTHINNPSQDRPTTGFVPAHPHIAIASHCLGQVAREMIDRGDPRDCGMIERIRNCLRRIGAEEAMDHDIITFEDVDEGHASPDAHGQQTRPGYGLHDDDTSHDTPMEPPSTVGSSYHAHEISQHQQW